MWDVGAIPRRRKGLKADARTDGCRLFFRMLGLFNLPGIFFPHVSDAWSEKHRQRKQCHGRSRTDGPQRSSEQVRKNGGGCEAHGHGPRHNGSIETKNAA